MGTVFLDGAVLELEPAVVFVVVLVWGDSIVDGVDANVVGEEFPLSELHPTTIKPRTAIVDKTSKLLLKFFIARVLSFYSSVKISNATVTLQFTQHKKLKLFLICQSSVMMFGSEMVVWGIVGSRSANNQASTTKAVEPHSAPARSPHKYKTPERRVPTNRPAAFAE